jgi:Na+-translocating ferredoxin:NAD+ oxidoreductase subunit G
MATPANEPRSMPRIVRSAALLLVVAIAGFGLVSWVHEATRDEIAAAARLQAQAQYATVLGGLAYDNDLLLDSVDVVEPDLLGTTAPVTVRRARRGDDVVAVVLAPVAPNGYGGSIHLLVGVDATGRVLGVRVTRHRETPGLGDVFEVRRSDWIERFRGRALGDPPRERWRVRRDGGDFDQFTGATVTPRAIVHAVANALVYFERHRDELLGSAATMDAP